MDRRITPGWRESLLVGAVPIGTVLNSRKTLDPEEQLLYRIVQRFRGGLVFKAHRLLYHSTLGLRVIQQKRKRRMDAHTKWHIQDAGGSIECRCGAAFPHLIRVEVVLSQSVPASRLNSHRVVCQGDDTPPPLEPQKAIFFVH